jgi:hypothetical protein
MKSTKFIHLLATSALLGAATLLMGCGKSGDKDKKTAAGDSAAQSQDAPPPAVPDGGKAENEAIQFHNSFSRFFGAARSPFEELYKTMKTSNEFIGRSTGKPRWASVISPTSGYKKIPDLKYAAPASLGAKEKEYFDTHIKTIKENTAAIINIVNELNTYYTADDYKDDWHKKFLMSEPKIEALVENVIKAGSEARERISAITEEIDRRNLAKIPIGIYVLNMRYMLDKSRDRARLLLTPDLRDTRAGLGISAAERQKMLAFAKPLAEKAEAIAKEMDEMAEKYKAADRANFKKVPVGGSLEKEYDGFFKRYEKSREDTRRIIRELLERGYYTDQHNVENNAGDLMKSHNAFVKIWNGK